MLPKLLLTKIYFLKVINTFKMKETKDGTNRKVSIRPKCLRNLRKGKLYPKQKDKGFYLKTFST